MLRRAQSEVRFEEVSLSEAMSDAEGRAVSTRRFHKPLLGVMASRCMTKMIQTAFQKCCSCTAVNL